MNLNVHLGGNVTIVNIHLQKSLNLTFLPNATGPAHQQSVSVHGATGTMDVSAPSGEAASGPDTTRVDGQEALSAPALSPKAKTALLAILWVFLVLLSLGSLLGLPAEVQAITGSFIGNLSLALIITWRVNDSRKH
jgi:hypothetical protein